MTNPIRIVDKSVIPLLLIGVMTGCGVSSKSGPAPMNLPAPEKNNGQVIDQPEPTTPKKTGLPSTAPASPAMPAAMPAVPTQAGVPMLKFAATSITQILAGQKTSTTRTGTRSFPGGMLTATGGPKPIQLDHVTTVTKKLSELTDADAKSDNSASVEVLKANLMKYSPDLTPDDPVTVITFTPVMAATTNP